MKLNFCALVLIFLSNSCSSQIKTDEKSVKKIVTTTEYLLLNQNFKELDSIHQQKQIQKFDGENKILEEMEFHGPSSIFGGGIIYKYAGNGNKTEEYLFDTHNEILSSSRYEYSQNHSNKFEVFKDGKKIKKGTIYFDYSGNIVRQITYYNDGKIMTDLYIKYDSASRERESGGVLDQKKIQTNYKSYDSLSHLVEQKSIDPVGKVLFVEKFTYEESDKNGNWKIRKSILNSKPYSVTFQSIVYR